MKRIVCVNLLLVIFLGLCSCSGRVNAVSMSATIIELTDKSALVEPVPQDSARSSSDLISFSTSGLSDIGAKVGDIVLIRYSGEIMESYPARIKAISWSMGTDAAAK